MSEQKYTDLLRNNITKLITGDLHAKPSIPQDPYAYLLVNDQGYIIGAWKEKSAGRTGK